MIPRTAVSDPLFKDIVENPWMIVPAAAVLLLAGFLHLLMRRERAGDRRRALLFGIGIVAVLASVVFGAFAYSFIMLLWRGDSVLDIVQIVAALGAGWLAVWLWLRFYRIVRQVERPAMRLSRPLYRNLQACRGLPDEEVERLTREVFKRNPKLAYYELLGCLVLLPAAWWLPRRLAGCFGVEFIWSLIIVAVVIGVPVILFERLVYGPAVNREMERLIAEQAAAATGGHPPLSKESKATEGPSPAK